MLATASLYGVVFCRAASQLDLIVLLSNWLTRVWVSWRFPGILRTLISGLQYALKIDMGANIRYTIVWTVMLRLINYFEFQSKVFGPDRTEHMR